MTEERWHDIKHQVKENFTIDEEYTEDLSPGTAEVIEFVSPQGKMKIRFISRPKVLDKKTTYSNRVGSDVKVDYVFSEDEVVSHLEILLWSDEDYGWRKIESDSLF